MFRYFFVRKYKRKEEDYFAFWKQGLAVKKYGGGICSIYGKIMIKFLRKWISAGNLEGFVIATENTVK